MHGQRGAPSSLPFASLVLVVAPGGLAVGHQCTHPMSVAPSGDILKVYSVKGSP